jgi:hypothetical protein
MDPTRSVSIGRHVYIFGEAGHARWAIESTWPMSAKVDGSQASCSISEKPRVIEQIDDVVLSSSAEIVYCQDIMALLEKCAAHV